MTKTEFLEYNRLAVDCWEHFKKFLAMIGTVNEDDLLVMIIDDQQKLYEKHDHTEIAKEMLTVWRNELERLMRKENER